MIVVLEFKVTVRGLAVEPLDQPLKLYPALGVAVILTCVPLANVPPPLTDPPSPALAVKVYWVTEVVGLVVFVGEGT